MKCLTLIKILFREAGNYMGRVVITQRGGGSEWKLQADSSSSEAWHGEMGRKENGKGAIIRGKNEIWMTPLNTDK